MFPCSVHSLLVSSCLHIGPTSSPRLHTVPTSSPRLHTVPTSSSRLHTVPTHSLLISSRLHTVPTHRVSSSPHVSIQCLHTESPHLLMSIQCLHTESPHRLTSPYSTYTQSLLIFPRLHTVPTHRVSSRLHAVPQPLNRLTYLCSVHSPFLYPYCARNLFITSRLHSVTTVSSLPYVSIQ